MYTIFSHPIHLCYKTPVFSKATFFYAISILLTFLAPLLMTYRSQGFWRKIDTYEEQPDVHFLHEVIVVLDTDQPERKIAWSTMKNFNQIMINAARVPTIKSFETDTNRDGQFDSLNFNMEMPLLNDENIYALKLFLLFDVKLHRFSSLQMQGLGYIQTSSGLAGSGLNYIGDLNLIQKQALSHKGRDNRFQDPVFDSNSLFAKDFDFQSILTSYNKRNLTVRLANDYLIWDHGTGRSFTIDVNINYPVQTLKYHPGFWQMLKWAWVQYFSVLMLFIALFRQVKMFVFTKQVLPTFPMFQSQDISVLKSKNL